ncbi:MAG: SGNH/GDSL hydrolase family protein [Candidatus Hydrogenedentes bacterium]|nr:SGNH/GDSL hydrolase family protein [Candidatus Hydrogenedentota bacterium]
MAAGRELLIAGALACAMLLGPMGDAMGQVDTREDDAHKSAAQVAWEKKLTVAERAQPGFAFVEEDPKLPRALLIGDSISIGYTPVVRELLKGKANVLRIPANGGSTRTGIANIEQWLGSGKWDVIHFNWGLHDIKHVKAGKLDVAGRRQVSAERYEKNLDKLVRRLKSTGAAIIWATTTPVPEGAGGRFKGDEVEVNKIAAKVMKKHGVPSDDLYAHVFPHLAAYQTPRNVHFAKEGYAFLGKQVAAAILDALDLRKGATARQSAEKDK